MTPGDQSVDRLCGVSNERPTAPSMVEKCTVASMPKRGMVDDLQPRPASLLALTRYDEVACAKPPAKRRLLPNGSRLSCGATPAGARRRSGRKKGSAARQRNSSLLVSARQLQAHVRQQPFDGASRLTTASPPTPEAHGPDCSKSKYPQVEDRQLFCEKPHRSADDREAHDEKLGPKQKRRC